MGCDFTLGEGHLSSCVAAVAPPERRDLDHYRVKNCSLRLLGDTPATGTSVLAHLAATAQFNAIVATRIDVRGDFAIPASLIKDQLKLTRRIVHDDPQHIAQSRLLFVESTPLHQGSAAIDVHFDCDSSFVRLFELHDGKICRSNEHGGRCA